LERIDSGGDTYAHIWEGKVRRVSDALIFRGRFIIEDFTPQAHWSTYHGCDFGFSSDPSAAIRAHVDGTTLYISAEFWGLHVELDRLSQEIEAAIPGSRNQKLYCDCARPESISYLTRHGHEYAVAAPKWSGSIEDGLAFLKTFERIVVSPKCRYMLDELRSYSCKVDKLTGKPTVEPEDRNNHLIDSLRYALADLIKQAGTPGILTYYTELLAAQSAAKTAAVNAPQKAEPLPGMIQPGTLWQKALHGGGRVSDL
jgi:phage terminase large subunit